MELASGGPGAIRIGDYLVDHALVLDTSEACYSAQHALLPRRARVRVAAAGNAAIRLLREAWVLEALGHRGVPRLYECGMLAGHQPWSAMEAIDGDSLAYVLAAGPLPVAEVLRVVRGVAEVLAHAHALGIVHGRVRADTIVLRDDVLPALVDWRDARVECIEETVRVPALDGTGPLFRAAPGGAQGPAVDGSGDVLALGIVAYRALTGQLPAGPATGPAPVVEMIEAMLAPGPLARPSAAAVASEAARIALAGAFAQPEPQPQPAPELEDLHLIDTAPVMVVPVCG
jgi:serine/threonine-protein kinase